MSSALRPSNNPAKPVTRRALGVGRVLIVVYAILAIGATSRAAFQFAQYYAGHPSDRLPIILSGVSGVIYILATLSLILPGRIWYRVAWITISFELVGVVVVGSLSLLEPGLFLGTGDVADGTVWSNYGLGYLCIPLVLPVLGLLWLRSRRAVIASS
jgi:hypothetical protein